MLEGFFFKWKKIFKTLGILFLLVWMLFTPLASQDLGSLNEEEKGLFQALITTYHLIREYSIHTNHTEPRDLIFSAISGMVDSLDDPYSVLLRGKALEQFFKNIDDHYSGIGIYIATNSRGILIVDVIPESPAWIIGLQANDIIIKVEGISLLGKNTYEVKALIMGPENSLVKITVLREGEELNFDVLRKSIQVRTVMTKSLPVKNKTLAYLRILNFSQNTSVEFREALSWAKTQRVTGIVIDVRNNPGGLLPVVIEMVDDFISRGTVVSTMTINQQPESVGADPQIRLPTFIPIAVLVNRYSASASEIFAGALKDHRRAVIIGENSFGKFSVQKLFQVWSRQQENAALKLTIARYFLPSGDSFDKIGIPPDVTITNQSVSPSLLGKEGDPFLDTAIGILTDLERYREVIGQ